jgi:hypothetical protein
MGAPQLGQFIIQPFDTYFNRIGKVCAGESILLKGVQPMRLRNTVYSFSVPTCCQVSIPTDEFRLLIENVCAKITTIRCSHYEDYAIDPHIVDILYISVRSYKEIDMNTLSHSTVVNIKQYIWTHCSPLTQALFTHHMEQPNRPGVLAALSAYQNTDGGFGHNLEGDFELPDSSAIATSVAFQIFVELEIPASESIVQKGIAYLLNTYDPHRPGWVTVPPTVNDYAHASWWHFNPEEGGSAIDHTWGNPTAELLGYLLHYPSLASEAVTTPLYAHTLDYLHNHPDRMEMHEVYCFLRLAQQMPAYDLAQAQDKLILLVQNAVSTDPESWQQYAAQPLDFVKHPHSFLYPLLEQPVQANLDFRVENLTQHTVMNPPWNWEGYEQAWQAARPEISGRNTVSDLVIMKRFGRLEV